MFFEILTLFPSMFDSVLSDSILKRAIDRQIISVHCDNIRDYSDNKHRKVDDYPYGGDAGMLMRPEPLAKAIAAAKKRLEGKAPKVIFMSPHGQKLDQDVVKELSQEQSLILLCGRYEGIDQRIVDLYVDREISLGDFVISGGEIAAMAVVDSVSRLIPGVLGNAESASNDSFYHGLLSAPNYTRPEVFEGVEVPSILLSGHHENIRQWQFRKAVELTKSLRPDLWQKALESGCVEKK